MTFKTHLLAMALVIPSVSACVADPVSTHDPRDFNDLVSERVWVFNWQTVGKKTTAHLIRATYFDPEGKHSTCWNYPAGYGNDIGYWKIAPRKDYRASLGFAQDQVPDPSSKKGWAPIFYAPDTGRFHKEAWYGGAWHVIEDGWIQDSWPRSMVEACPDLPLPATLKINEKQTSTHIDEVRKQDPDAPIRNFKGKFPMTNQVETGMSLDGLLEMLTEHEGKILQSNDGQRFALNFMENRDDELWVLGKDDEIVDVGLFHLSDGHGAILIKWRNSGTESRFEFGDNFPLAPTDQSHPAFAFIKWFGEQEDGVPLTFNGEPVNFVAQEDGKLVAEQSGEAGQEVIGSWWLESGRLVLSLPEYGISELAWADAAREAGWPDVQAGPAK